MNDLVDSLVQKIATVAVRNAMRGLGGAFTTLGLSDVYASQAVTLEGALTTLVGAGLYAGAGWLMKQAAARGLPLA